MLKNKSLPYNVAMTGEISLRGIVLPVGGIKEKLVRAKNAGIKTVFIPSKTKKTFMMCPMRLNRAWKYGLSTAWMRLPVSFSRK
ncbi:MAG: hypothetical protein JXB48_18110 [Candidatus Latescibacteria bacterium]|nr:hypothetical protein [Candidatus Latescibacterota bacterium]